MVFDRWPGDYYDRLTLAPKYPQMGEGYAYAEQTILETLDRGARSARAAKIPPQPLK